MDLLLVLLDHLVHHLFLVHHDQKNRLHGLAHLYLILEILLFLYLCHRVHGNYYWHDYLLYQNLPCLCCENCYFHHLFRRHLAEDHPFLRVVAHLHWTFLVQVALEENVHHALL